MNPLVTQAASGPKEWTEWLFLLFLLFLSSSSLSLFNPRFLLLILPCFILLFAFLFISHSLFFLSTHISIISSSCLSLFPYSTFILPHNDCNHPPQKGPLSQNALTPSLVAFPLTTKLPILWKKKKINKINRSSHPEVKEGLNERRIE